MDEGLQHVLDGARDRAGVRSELPGAAVLRRLHPVGVSRHRAVARDRRQPSRRLSPRREERRASRRRRSATSPSTGGNITYNKTALWLNTMERWLGWPTMQRIMSTYFDAWKFRHPKPDDFFAHGDRRSAGRDLAWFFDQVVSQLERVRLRRAGPEERARRATGFRTTVVVRRYGEAIVSGGRARDIRERRAGRPSTGTGASAGSSYTYERPVAGACRRQSIRIACCCSTSTTRTTRGRCAPQGAAAATKWSLKWMVWLQDLLLSWAALRMTTRCARLARRHAGRVNRAPAILAGVWLLTLLVSLPLALGAARHDCRTAWAQPRGRHGGERRELRLDAGVRRPGQRRRRHVQADDHRVRRGPRQPERVPRRDTRPPVVIVGAAAAVYGAVDVPRRRHHRSATRAIARRARTASSPRPACSSSAFCGSASCSGSSTALLFGSLHPWLFDRLYPRLMHEIDGRADRVLHSAGAVSRLRPARRGRER